MRFLFLVIILCYSFQLNSQFYKNSEIGLDGSFSASTLGGASNLGIKYGLTKNENYIYGPSFRIMKYWSSFNGINYNFNLKGYGGFFHYRYQNTIFLGGELEVFKINYALTLGAKSPWIPTLFLGAGFSKEYYNKFRVNVGIFYDVVNNLNSPFRVNYKVKNSLGMLIPVTYRFAFFIPIFKAEKDKETGEFENEE